MWGTMRTRAGSLVLLLGSLALGGCSDGAAVAIPAEGPWTIAFSSEGGIGAALACLDDEAVTDGLQSADMPASSGSGVIGADRSAEDVQRVVDCVKRLVPDAAISVTSRAS